MLLHRGQVAGWWLNNRKNYGPHTEHIRGNGLWVIFIGWEDVLPLLLLLVVGERGPRVLMIDGRLAKKESMVM